MAIPPRIPARIMRPADMLASVCRVLLQQPGQFVTEQDKWSPLDERMAFRNSGCNGSSKNSEDNAQQCSIFVAGVLRIHRRADVQANSRSYCRPSSDGRHAMVQPDLLNIATR